LPLKLYLTYKINYDLKGYESEVNMNEILQKDNLRNKEVFFELKNVYGNDLIYPSCHIANALIKLKSTKTFTKNDLNVFRALGMIVKWKAGQI